MKSYGIYQYIYSDIDTKTILGYNYVPVLSEY